MRKVIVALLSTVALAGCATVQKADTTAAAYICANKEALIFAFTTIGDANAIKAIDDYCAGTTVSAVAPVGG